MLMTVKTDFTWQNSKPQMMKAIGKITKQTTFSRVLPRGFQTGPSSGTANAVSADIQVYFPPREGRGKNQ